MNHKITGTKPAFNYTALRQPRRLFEVGADVGRNPNDEKAPTKRLGEPLADSQDLVPRRTRDAASAACYRERERERRGEGAAKTIRDLTGQERSLSFIPRAVENHGTVLRWGISDF